MSPCARPLLDGATAPISRNAQGQIVLFVREAGRHRLDLEFQAPVVISAAQQSLQLRLPVAGSSRLQVVVPGNVEVKSGAQVVQRQYEEASDQTRFELLFQDGAIAVVMSLNNRRLREDRVVLSRAVLVSELTTSYERLHATVEMNVLHGAVDRFLFDVPAGFQITSVASPLLSQWIIRQEEGREVLEINLREPTRGHETLNIAATRAPVVIGQWSMPTLKPRDVAGQVSVIGVLAETRLRPLNVVADNLIRIDTSVLRSALPESVLQAEPGAPEIRPIAAFYGPGDAFGLSAAFEDPRDELRVATHLLLSLGEEQQTLRGGFTLTPQAAKQTAFAFRMPSDWQLQKVYGADQQALTYHRYPLEKETRYVVTLPTAIEPGTTVTIYFEASYRSSSWLGDWTSLDVEFPRIAVEQATDASGAIAVQPTGDLTAKPLTIEGLTPLDANQRGRFGLAESANELTYQVSADAYRAVFRVERTQPRISTRNYSFFEIRDRLAGRPLRSGVHHRPCAHEPPGTGIACHDPHDVVHPGSERHSTERVLASHAGWKTHLDRAVGQRPDGNGRARHRLRAADRGIDDTGAGNVSLPVIRAANVAYQTQMVSVESGDPTLDVDRTNEHAPCRCRGTRGSGVHARSTWPATARCVCLHGRRHVDPGRRRPPRPASAAGRDRRTCGARDARVDIRRESIGSSLSAPDQAAVPGHPVSGRRGTLVRLAQWQTDQTAATRRADRAEPPGRRGRDSPRSAGRVRGAGGRRKLGGTDPHAGPAAVADAR